MMDKKQYYLAGWYSCAVPGVTTQSWSPDDWITWIDAHGVWKNPDVKESKDILESEDLYELQDKFCSSGIPFQYRMTEGELGWLDFVRQKYVIADWVEDNLEGDILTFDCPDTMSRALDDDCEGWGKATMLADDTALQKLFFWLYCEDLNDEI